MEAIEPMLREFTARIKRQFAEEISRDPASFKRQVIGLIRRGLPPGPGRPKDPRIEAALRMLHQGATVKAVLRSQIRDFDNLDAYERYLAEKGLRTALARRRRSQAPP
jgi:hypothetical protein